MKIYSPGVNIPNSDGWNPKGVVKPNPPCLATNSDAREIYKLR